MDSVPKTVMARQLRFCRGAGTHRLAYSVVGQGPTVVVPPGWVSHQEVLWNDPDFGGFYGALAAHHRVITYDKHGTGLSDRDRADLGLDADLADLERLVNEVAGDRFILFSSSMGGPLAVAYAARHPDRVSHLVVHGGFARGDAVSPREVQGSLISLVRANWGLGSRLLAVVFIPGERHGGIDRWCRFQREGASPEMAAALLQSFFENRRQCAPASGPRAHPHHPPAARPRHPAARGPRAGRRHPRRPSRHPGWRHPHAVAGRRDLDLCRRSRSS